MTTVEKHNLERCEAIIERHYAAFVEVGLALLEIREQRYYKADGFTSFGAYVRERLGNE